MGPIRHGSNSAVALLLVSFACGPVWCGAPVTAADPPPPEAPPPAAPATAEAPPPPKSAPRQAICFAIAMGNYDADDNAGTLDDERGQFAYTVGLGFRFNPALTFGLEVTGHTVDFDAPAVTPPFLGTISDEYDLVSTGMVLSLAAESPRGPVRPFAAAGIGLYKVRLSRYGSLVGFPGTVAEEEEFSGGLHLAAGLAFMFNTRAGLTLEYRRLFLDADFGALTAGEVEVGGAMVLGGFRYVGGI